MDLELAGRRALIVGGSGLIGSAVARSMLAEGARVVLAGRTESALADVTTQLNAVYPSQAAYAILDSAAPESVSAGMKTAVDVLGGLDVLVNSGAPPASTLVAAPESGDDLEEVAAAFDGKAMGYLRCARAALPYLSAARDGRIINVIGQNTYLTNSVAAAVRNVAAAAVSKCLVDEAAGTGVTVNAVHPGPVDADSESDPQLRPLGSYGVVVGSTNAAAVADLVTFLASARAATISGASIDIGHAVKGVLHI